MEDILARIIKLRQARGWSEYQLAVKSALPQSTISSWYRKNLVPSVQSLEKICTAFDISLSQLFAGEGETVELTESQRLLLERWAALDHNQQQAVLKLMETMAGDKL